MTSTPVLEVRDLTTTFHTPRGDVQALEGVSLSLAPGETLGVVGESGGGKSVLARTLMGLVTPETSGSDVSVTGESLLDGRDLLRLDRRSRRQVWGAQIATVFQNPMTSLNPVRRIGSQLVSAIRLHLPLGRREAAVRAVELLERVRIPDAARRLRQYPHELSGGMRQRVCIALALACDPKVLLADEPTTALDVTVQHQILTLLSDLAAETAMATMLITHDLGVVAHQVQRIAVLYAGRIVEQGTTDDVLRRHRHPYTAGLLAAMPRLADPSGTPLRSLGGHPPDPTASSPGCAFAPRCPRAVERCRHAVPELRPVDDERPGGLPAHEVACHLATEPEPTDDRLVGTA
jgi:peptide/nickel transport system ATP-binding protein